MLGQALVSLFPSSLTSPDSASVPPEGSSFGNTIVRIEAVAEVLAVLVRGMIGQHLLAGGALEGLEAGLALDCLRGGILAVVSATCLSNVTRTGLSGRTHSLELTLGLLGTGVALALALLLCPAAVC